MAVLKEAKMGFLIKDDINRWKETMFLDWKNQYCQNDYTTNAIYTFKAISIKLAMAFFTEQQKNSYNLYGDTKDPK